MDVQDLLRDAAEQVWPAQAEDVTRAVYRQLDRRRRMRIGMAAVAAIAVVAAGVTGQQYWHRSVTAPAASAPALPADRAVGAGARVVPDCVGGRCTPVLTTVDGHSYRLPGPVVPDAHSFTGVGLSPSGRWVAYNSHGAVVLRDLTGTKTVRASGSGNLGGPSAWSANERWVLVQPLDRTARGLVGPSDTVLRVDLRSGRTMRVHVRKILHLGPVTDGFNPILSVLPDGLVAYPVAGAKPTGTPTMASPDTLGSGAYKLIDPGAGTVVRTVSADDVNVWTPVGSSHSGGSMKVEWDAQLPGPLVATGDGTRAVVLSEYGSNTDTRTAIAFVDLATGQEHTVDVTHLLARAGLHDARYWGAIRYTGGRITLLASTSDRHTRWAGEVTLDGTATHVLSTRHLGYPAATTVLPGTAAS